MPQHANPLCQSESAVPTRYACPLYTRIFFFSGDKRALQATRIRHANPLCQSAMRIRYATVSAANLLRECALPTRYGYTNDLREYDLRIRNVNPLATFLANIVSQRLNSTTLLSS